LCGGPQLGREILWGEKKPVGSFLPRVRALIKEGEEKLKEAKKYRLLSPRVVR